MESTSWTEEEWGSLLEAIKYKQCTPFLGAGACAGTLPTGKSIAQEWATEYGYPFPDRENLSSVSQYLAVRDGALGSMTPKLKIRDRFSGKGPPDFSEEAEPHRVVADLELPVYITTNYDNFMLAALQRDGRRTPYREVCQWKPQPRRRTLKNRPNMAPSPDHPLVFHLHGTLDEPDTMVLTEDDYLDFLTSVTATRGLIPAHVEAALSNSCLLFLGYSLNDMNFKVLFRKLAWYMQRTEGTRHISVQLAPAAQSTAEEEQVMLRRQCEYLETHFRLQRVKVYWGSCASFAAELAPDGGLSMAEQGRNPYVGPRPFSGDDEAVFFGRETEACEILSLVLAYPAVVLYSESGAGKTSLLNARIVPGLLERGCEVIGPVRVSAEFGEEFVKSGNVNVYTLSSLLLMDRETKDVARLARLTLREYLDQRPKPETPHAIRPPRVVIFDQFEELFTTRPERWQDRARFMEDIGNALEADSRLRVVFALREEFIASLDALAAELPDGLRTRMRLERLRRPAALDAIEKPLQGTNVSFAPGVSDLILDNLLRIPSLDGREILDEFIEPVHLQLVCHRVWELLPPDTEKIQAKDVDHYGDVDTALRAYYDFCVSRVAAGSGRAEGQLRSWFQKNFITTDGTRGLVYRTVSNTGGLPNAVVDQFQALYLIRAETRGQSRWYELAHDRLIAPIIESNRAWRTERDEASLLIDALEKQAEKWVQTKDAGLLLRGNELLEARKRIERDEEPFTVSVNLRTFVDTSEIARERRLRRRLGRQIAAGAAAALLLTALIFYVRWRTQRAETAQIFASVATRVRGVEALNIDALSWALRAYAGSSDPHRYDKILREALKRVGPTLWLKRDAPIQTALFSSDGKRVITVAAKEICIWDAEAGTKTTCRDAPTSRLWVEAFFSRSGIVLAQSVPDPAERRKQFTSESSMEPKRWTLWDPETDRLLPQLEDIARHEDVSVAPDRSILAVAYEPKLPPRLASSRGVRWIRLFDLKQNRKPLEIQGDHAFSFISLSSDGKFLLTVDESAARIWETATAKQVMKVKQPVGYDDVPFARWDKTTVFVAFRSPDQFQPTLIRLGRHPWEATERQIPYRALDASFGILGGEPRLLVRANAAPLNDGVIRAYLFDYNGIVQPQEFESESPESSYWYGGYFKTGEIVSVQEEKDTGDRSIGTSYSVIAKDGTRRTVRLPYLDYTQLTAVSSSQDRLLSVANGVARLWNIDHAREMETLPTEKLVATACARFTNQDELRSVLASENVCTDETLIAVETRM